MMRNFTSLLLILLLTACMGKDRAPAPYKNYGLHGGADSAGVHTISRDDTLWNISQRYGLDMQDIIYANKLKPPYSLAVNQRLKLPPPNHYKVKHGDTLYNVSRTFNVSLTQLARINELQEPYIVHEGDVLKLPSSYSRIDQTKKTFRHIAKLANKSVQQAREKISQRTPARAGSKFGWPVSGRVISAYGPKQDGGHNDGINIETTRGSPVVAAENGVVVYAGNALEGYGNLVLIRHSDRWVTAYAHMDDILTWRGQEVNKGQYIGKAGSSGNVASPQLHFETRRGTQALDPMKYLGNRRS
jgi:murein DD-endopeptidase MepM/ murein hydrolase activator NlpD